MILISLHRNRISREVDHHFGMKEPGPRTGPLDRALHDPPQIDGLSPELWVDDFEARRILQVADDFLHLACLLHQDVEGRLPWARSLAERSADSRERYPVNTVSGVRSSCAAMFRKELLAWLAAAVDT